MLCALLASGCSGREASDGSAHLPAADVLNPAAWPMHLVAGRFRGANALGPGDVNQDGFPDYVTNYEFDQRYVVSLHPGPEGDPKQPWPAVAAWSPNPLANGNGVNPEHAALADLDGDGNPDIAAAQGWSDLAFWEGSEPGIRIVWGPPPDLVLEPSAWIDGGRIPATTDRGHFLYVVPADINRDGACDILSGGRIHGGNGRKAGVVWIEAPAAGLSRRNLALWRIHDIDPEQTGAHGLVLSDVDRDGDEDILLANADWDTAESDERLLWYENPGVGSPAQMDPWPVHEIYRGEEFYAKPQVCPADLDQDGLEDVLTQTREHVYWFRKTGLDPVTWEKIPIEKDPVARWSARALRVADFDQDGRLDIAGMLVHEDGTLPAEKAAAFWMSYTGERPGTDNWVTRVIRWGSGRQMVLPIFGEKWDQMQLEDVDRDGDLDIVANCEEWWEQDIEFRFFWDPRSDPDSVAVVWFENRLSEAPCAFEERQGLCVFEAEHWTDLLDGAWIQGGRYPGYSGHGYLQDRNALDSKSPPWDDEGRGVRYSLRLSGGSYVLWLRRWVPSRWGFALSGLGGRRSEWVWIGLDGSPLEECRQAPSAPFDSWQWVRCEKTIDIEAGEHVLELRRLDGGFAVDRILLAADPGDEPTGLGPGETRASGRREQSLMSGSPKQRLPARQKRSPISKHARCPSAEPRSPFTTANS